MELNGIHNHNEFFFEHYLTHRLGEDLRERLSAWEAEGAASPARQVRAQLRSWNSEVLRKYETLRGSARDAFVAEHLTSLAQALGYTPGAGMASAPVGLAQVEGLKLFASASRTEGAPGIWVLLAREPLLPVGIVSAPDAEAEEADIGRDTPLLWPVSSLDWTPSIPKGWQHSDATLDRLLGEEIFARDAAPRWVLLLSPWQIILCDRNKWAERRFLRFDLETLSSRKEDSALHAVAALLHRTCLHPDEGLALVDELDENSHKNAFGVSENLKYALRECIEDLGNEAVWYIRGKLHARVFDRDLAPPLTRECLRYMYRLLFLFYLEARPELGYFPKRQKMRNRDPYWSGYSLESLRDLEMVKLTTEESRNGYFLHHSLRRLMDMVYKGFRPSSQVGMGFGDGEESFLSGFELKPLNAHLFDPEYDPEGGNGDILKLLHQVKFRNRVLQKVIQRMSLGKSGTGKRSRRGRISYAQLGINQLGAVYEGLLSFRGFFAEEELFEVRRLVKDKKADDDAEGEEEGGEGQEGGSEAEAAPSAPGAVKDVDPLDTAYFVNREQLAQCTPEEKVWVHDGAHPKVKSYPKGTFIYRMAGRDREKSASYYTPAELTQTLVKYALKELLKDKSADQILDLTVCEPAMGSAAFLNEAVDQLADAYLQRKQAEAGKHLPIEAYAHEKQKVKMFLADNRVFGVDLNPVAVELAEVSLWLGTLHPDALVPWFRLQLNCGNSLVGARRAVFSFHGLDPREPGEQKRQPWDQAPARGTAWHWLLPDAGMADFNDKVIKTIAPKGLEDAKKWRKGFCGPIAPSEQALFESHTQAAEKLWQAHAKQLAVLRKRTSDVIEIWGQSPREQKISTTREKDKILDGELYSRSLHAASPYRRLKLAMDYWCALWFWPIEKSHLLPDRQQWLLEMGLLLHGEVQESEVAEQSSIFPDTAQDEYKGFLKQHGLVDVDALVKKFERFRMVEELAERHRFFHWELEYADVFMDRRGFDLVLGNPPWLKVEWEESGVLGDANPLFVLRGERASDISILREETLHSSSVLRSTYIREYESTSGLQGFLGSLQNYPELRGTLSNLFKNFLPVSFGLLTSSGVSAFIHQDGIYDDPNGDSLREEVYQRLAFHLQFQNEKKYFPIGNRKRFSLNIYRSLKASPNFVHISNLFIPRTIDDIFHHDGNGEVEGIKTIDNKWCTAGHKLRSVQVGPLELSIFAQFFDEPGTPPLRARLPSIHTQSLVEVIRKLAQFPVRMNTFNENYFPTVMWDEAGGVKKGTLRRNTAFPKSQSELVISGPHFHVNNPFYQTPRSICQTHRAYDSIDLTFIPDDYLPRSNYAPAVPPDEYKRRTMRVTWGEEHPVSDFYRVGFRKMVSASDQRTLVPALLPKKVRHIDGCFSVACNSNELLLRLIGYSSSLVADFFIKTTGKSNIRDDLLSQFPLPIFSPRVVIRILTLNCITNAFADFWRVNWNDHFVDDHWLKSDPRLSNAFWNQLQEIWSPKSVLKSDYSRRQAQIEIDVFIARLIGISLDELKTIYRIQFPVLRLNESDTWYDSFGRIVFTVSKGLPGVGLPRVARKGDRSWSIDAPGWHATGIALGWEQVRDLKEGVITRTIQDDTLPGGPKPRTITYVAPFDRCDREADYRTAWEMLENTPG